MTVKNTACENVGNFRKNDRIKPEEDRLETIYRRKWQEIVPAFLNRQEKNNIRSPLAFQGRFEPKYLQNYLDEYVFRFNRRKSKSIGKKFMRIVQQVINSCKIRKKDIQFDLDPISEYFSLGFCA